MEKIKAVVFDLDGTLVDSLADISSAVNSTLVAHGRTPHPLEAYNAMVGWGLRRLLITASAEKPFSDVELEVVYEELLGVYRAKPVVNTRAYDGIHALTASLVGRVPLGVLSNKDDGMTKIIVGTLFPGGRFDSVTGARPGKPHKPDPTVLLEMLGRWGVAPEACVYVGDSDIDMKTARAAGTIPCGAAWGFRGESELVKAGAAQVFPDPLALRAWLEPRLVRN